MSTAPFTISSSDAPSSASASKRPRATTLHATANDPAAEKAIEGLVAQCRKELERRMNLWLISQAEFLHASHCWEQFKKFPHVALLPPQLRTKLPITPFSHDALNLPYIQAALDYRSSLMQLYVKTCETRRTLLEQDVSTDAICAEWDGRIEVIARTMSEPTSYTQVLANLSRLFVTKCREAERDVMGASVAKQFQLLDERKKRSDKIFQSEWKQVVGDQAAFDTNVHLLDLFRRQGERNPNPTHHHQPHQAPRKPVPHPKAKPQGKRPGRKDDKKSSAKASPWDASKKKRGRS